MRLRLEEEDGILGESFRKRLDGHSVFIVGQLAYQSFTKLKTKYTII
jgi:hypothetical protein